MQATPKVPSLLISLIPLVALIIMLMTNVTIFGDDALSGSNQLILIFAAAIGSMLAMLQGLRWEHILEGIVASIKIATPAILLLLMVGALSGTWLLSGIVPAMIYYGLSILQPSYFLLAASLISVVVSLATGSSWSTAATVGIALMGIGTTLGVHPGMVAGAILSGAYFGDKLSPLSDTTNLAAGASGVELFAHIRYMTITTLPSIGIALVIYLLMGFFVVNSDSGTDVSHIQNAIDQRFNINPLLMLVPAAVIFMIYKKVPALPAIFVGAIMGAVFAFIFQYPLLQETGEKLEYESFLNYKTIMHTMYGDTAVVTGDAAVDDLLSSSGMFGMLNTIWLIITAMIFAGVMQSAGFLQRITQALISLVRSDGDLVAATAGTCVLSNVTTSDQYLAVTIPAGMFNDAYDERGLDRKNLSRTLEDSGTVTSVLVPWNTCGAYHAGVLGVATLSYAPFAFFCLISPFMTLLFAYRNIKIARI